MKFVLSMVMVAAFAVLAAAQVTAPRVEARHGVLKGDVVRLWCFAISAKRYALFLRDARGEPVLLRENANNENDRWSEHGLGHLLNPIDPDADDREWIAQVWLNIIRRALSLRTNAVGFESLPAVGRLAISSPLLLGPFAAMNRRNTTETKSSRSTFFRLVTCGRSGIHTGRPSNIFL
jgi:hypothetical protein